jgi:TM2 domain-containing membrane protein YozV
MALISCRECGKQISDQAVACPNCGVPNRPGRTPDPVSVIAPKSRSMAILWAMLLGGIGIRWFYLDQPGWGILYLLFCWTFIPAIVGFVQGLFFLNMSDGEFQDASAGLRPFGWLGH